MATINNNNPTKTDEDHHLNINNINLGNYFYSPVSSTTNEGIGRNRDGHENKVFVGGLHSSTTAEKLSNYFYQFGSIVDVVVLMDPITKKNRGFGLVTFAESSSVGKVLSVPIHMLDGRKIDVKHATPRSPTSLVAIKTNKLFIGGVSQTTSVEDVKAYLNLFGEVEAAVLIMDQATKRHRGFGFATMFSFDAVDEICKMRFHTINGKRVECKKSQTKQTITSLNLLATLKMNISACTSTEQVVVTAANYSRMLARAGGGGLSSLGNYRYSPYYSIQLPNLNTTNINMNATYPSSYGSFPLAPPPIDASCLQNLNWPQIYNNTFA